ncbi:MAG: MerR family DNA-binding transcriptional regulator [Anaerolineales bacterium]|nr:MerR family DNA-binding transcriptional regulator [Anaerolineales bacterium]
MKIRKLVQKTGVLALTIRYYEDIGLHLPTARKPNGYRNSSEIDVDRLKLECWG